jgi:LuxR family transcriptional regulator, maltose regulon positive regulatory protein
MVTSTAARGTTHSRQGTGADDPVLASKITAPSVPAWAVPRPRIGKLIAQGARGPLTVVTGAPGSGKTMALALWADSAPGAVAWVTLDEYDNRPRVFWSYVVAALQRAGISVPRALSVTARGSAVDHVFLLRFASAMAAHDPPVALVLDDLHVLTEPKVLDGLAYVLRNAGFGLHLVTSSRMDPLLPLHRYRLSGQLTEIRADELVFSIPESRQLLAQHGLQLSAESLECLVGRTEGWAAGMRLAAISIDGQPDPGQFIKQLAAEDSAVTSYLVEEVLNAQPAGVRDFLLRTSILDRVCADIAGELDDDEPATDVLAALARTNTFVLPLGHGWYRYHSLFGGVLRLKLRQESPDQVPDLHRRAAGWYRRNGSLTEAVRHAAAARDWLLAARMVVDELGVGQLIAPRGNEQLADEFRCMPQDPTWTEPQPMLVDAGAELSRGRDDSAGASLAAAESLLEHLPADAEIPARLAAALIRLALSRRTGNLDAAAAAAAAAEALLGAIPEELLARHPEICAQVLSGRGAVELWSGQLDEAATTLNAGVLAASAADSEYERADCLGQLAVLEALRGGLRRAAELAAEATGPIGHELGIVSPAAEVALACVHLEHNERSLARDRLQRADEALQACPDMLISAAACMIAARHSLAEDRPAAVLEIVGRLRHEWSPPSWLDHGLTILQSRAFAAISETQSAVDTAVSAWPASWLDAAVALAHAYLAAGDAEAAAQALARGPAGAEAPASVRLEAWLADAQLSYGRGDRSHGRRSLENALRLGEPEQIRLTFAMQRAWLQPVLRHDPDLACGYRQLLEPDLVSPSPPPPAKKPGLEQAGPLIVEQLSEREHEVLLHASAMLSTAEIATEMYISVNTVKTHLKSIYRKLAATQRSEAVRRARQLKLL